MSLCHDPEKNKAITTFKNDKEKNESPFTETEQSADLLKSKKICIFDKTRRSECIPCS